MINDSNSLTMTVFIRDARGYVDVSTLLWPLLYFAYIMALNISTNFIHLVFFISALIDKLYACNALLLPIIAHAVFLNEYSNMSLLNVVYQCLVVDNEPSDSVTESVCSVIIRFILFLKLKFLLASCGHSGTL